MRQKITAENLELLELLRIRKRFFPERYKQTVVELEKRLGAFNTFSNSLRHMVLPEYDVHKVYLSYSGNCGTLFNAKTFNSEFEALEYSLISSLNGRKTEMAYACTDKLCSICESFNIAQ